jgi:hypothetical protein
MALFIGTLLITILSCLALAVGLLLRGHPLRGGCGARLPGSERCADCPQRKAAEAGDEEPRGDR